MAQVKKAHVRQAILDSAYRLFKKRGYVATTTAQITKAAKVSEANLYVYFNSKFEVLLALYEPWLRERIHRLEGKVENESDPRRRLKLILTTLWCELPTDDNGFTNNLMQALSTTAGSDGYRPDLLRWTEARVEALILLALPQSRRAELANRRLAHMLMMAQDGLAMHFHLNESEFKVDDLIDLVCNLILGNAASDASIRHQKAIEGRY
jgi:AcrR family transcriptional regulator